MIANFARRDTEHLIQIANEMFEMLLTTQKSIASLQRAGAIVANIDSYEAALSKLIEKIVNS
jgi:ribonuclease D